MTTYAGKKVVITGGTHGIGMAVAERLLDGGAEVLITGRKEANLVAAKERLAGRAAHVMRSDASNLDDIKELGRAVKNTLGEVDLVFVNVSRLHFGPLGHVDEQTYDDSFDTTTKGAFFTAQELAPLVRDGGAFVFTTAVAVGMGFVDTAVGTGMKSAIRGFVKVFASELLHRGIRVNAVSPGFIETPTMGVAEPTEELIAAIEEEGGPMTPMNRFGTPDEVATAVLFLGFDATFTTGSELPVDGGLGEGLEKRVPDQTFVR
ncbi:SDR family oxidoreductase [Kibdelosporangium aridum]|uniref:NAD(P)-dependent dehydrogenase, short-chain alcohol dehydrogenase family n=1 Tax=Kibdelosporangium aridum TaxID=2030 RepID=A0A1Y5Y950_KIBAR|nr:SDR family oxidoreductase [Kibdelosporangium aridum]SMD25892.1 NAD(P)-dependent dehydrogenase, short-chain alcohol dehydrogenase family [Kibdelosporangium aridum]